MNYYSFHLGDYAAHTRHLSLLEDLAYRRMLDLYYTSEAPLPSDPAKVARLIGMRDHMQEVTDVLSEFFVKSDAGHMSARCEREIETYQAKAERAKSANKARWTPKQSDEGSNPDLKSDTKSDLKSESAQIPTKNQEPRTKEEPPIPPTGGSVPQRSKGETVTLQTFLENCKVKGERPLRDYAPLWQYAESAGLPKEFVALAWVEFCRRFLPEGTAKAKRYADWRRAFRKYVESGYLRLWAIDANGVYFLTSQGKQAQKVHESKEAA